MFVLPKGEYKYQGVEINEEESIMYGIGSNDAGDNNSISRTMVTN